MEREGRGSVVVEWEEKQVVVVVEVGEERVKVLVEEEQMEWL